MATQYYGKAESAAKRILELFRSGNVPQALAPMFIRRKDNVPCRAWSWSNQPPRHTVRSKDRPAPPGFPRSRE